MNTKLNTAKWAVALLAPWAIAPHPNFGSKNADVTERLALIVDFRQFEDDERYSNGIEEWESDLLRAAAQSLLPDTQASATEELWSIAANESLPAGARAASAVFGSVGLSELELADEAARRLKTLIDSLQPALQTDSERLVLAVLAQQRVLRLFDSAQYTEAGAAVESILKLYPTSPKWDERFEVSEGVSWDALTVQSDVLTAIVGDALEARSSLEFPSGTTWMNVVRARPGWIDLRQAYRSAERDSVVLRDAFESRFESTRGTVHMGRPTATLKGYAALLLAELAGNTQLVRRNREQLGRVTMLADHRDEATALETLRLFRQAGQARPMQAALSWMRDTGPTTAITKDAQRVIERCLRGKWTTELDLILLEAAAEFLTPSEREDAITASILALRTESISGRFDWSLHEKVWRAVARLVEDTDSHDAVAREVLKYLDNPQLLVEPLVSTLERLMRSLDWDQVSEQAATAWTVWATEVSGSEAEGEHTALAAVVLKESNDEAEAIPSTAGLQQAVHLLNHVDDDATQREAIAANRLALAEALEADAVQAAGGVYTFGGSSPADIAVAFATRFGGHDLWAALTTYLTNSDIDRSMKSRALDRLAREPSALPEEFALRLTREFSSVLNSRARDGFFSQPTSDEFAEALRLGCVLGAVDEVSAIGSIMRLAAGLPPARIEAAKSAPFVRNEDATWVHTFLLQMTLDENSLVSAEAGAAIVATLGRKSSLSEMAERRAVELLLAEGTRRPLRIMQTIRAEARRGELRGDFLQALEALAATATSRVVREHAKLTLEASNKA